MTSARVGIRHLFEMIAAVACGLALARLGHGDQPIGKFGPRFVVEPVLAGTAAIGALLLAWETVRRQYSRPWGIGRWAWAVAGLYVVVQLTDNFVMVYALRWMRGSPLSVGAAVQSTMGAASVLFHAQVFYVFLIIWLLTRSVKPLHDPDPDARELTGRLLAAAIIAWGVAYRVLSVLGRA